MNKKQFDGLYQGKIHYSILTRCPETDEELLNELLISKLWRLNNLYTIIDKEGNRIIMKMNDSQHIVYAASLNHPRLIILKSRQQGISTFWLISFLDDLLFYPDLNAGLMAQGLPEASMLLKRVKLAWNAFSPELTAMLSLTLSRDNTAELEFSNNSTMFIRTSFRSAVLQRLHISEFGKIAKENPKRAQETKTGTLQTISPKNIAIVESTAEEDNEFKRMWDNAVLASERKSYAPKDFMPIFLPWVNDPDCWSDINENYSAKEIEYFSSIETILNITLKKQQKNFWVSQYREIGDLIYQEYPATPQEAFMKVNDGSYYGISFSKLVSIIPDLYDPNLDTFVSMDLGIDDYFVLLYFQRWRDEWRIIDEYYDSGNDLAFYVNKIRSTGYNVKTIFAPHDIRVRELATGKSRLSTLRELGATSVIALKKSPVEEGINKVRSIFPLLSIDPKCSYIIKGFKYYSKEWDPKREMWKNVPSHDKWSHGMDAVRAMAMSPTECISTSRKKLEKNYAQIIDGLAL
ncbi:MAG TPA: hypothetical protein ENI67_04750 [Gammaproteobacteria bacterium]|nr:hypothetical protein [Gammaproteobacteria bacterium]